MLLLTLPPSLDSFRSTSKHYIVISTKLYRRSVGRSYNLSNEPSFSREEGTIRPYSPSLCYPHLKQCTRPLPLLPVQVVPVESGSRTLKDAINEAMRDWVTNVVDTHYLIGSAIGPHPFPTIVRDFQSVIGKEARSQVNSTTPRARSEPCCADRFTC